VRVAVCGSCVTRDAFNRRFNPDYRERFECVALSNQASLLSLAAPPLAVPPDALTELDAKAQAEVRQELGRTFTAELARTRPEFLGFDFFADVHFGCAYLAPWHRHLVTRNRWKIAQTAFYRDAHHADLPPTAPRYFARWTRAADRFVRTARQAAPEAAIILNKTQNALSFLDDDGRPQPFAQAAELAAGNTRWARLNSWFAGRHADAVISVLDADPISPADHPWGPFPVHYEMAYYQRFLAALDAIAHA
jgi:hypothetical protein